MTTLTTPKYVIFDTDMGSDDAWALQMLLKAEKHLQNIKVLAITTVFGNTTTEHVIRNTYRILDGLDRTDVSIFINSSLDTFVSNPNLLFAQISIYKGAAEALIPGDMRVGVFFGSNGFSGVDFWKPHYPSDLKSLIQPKHAIEIIRDLVMEVSLY